MLEIRKCWFLKRWHMKYLHIQDLQFGFVNLMNEQWAGSALTLSSSLMNCGSVFVVPTPGTETACCVALG